MSDRRQKPLSLESKETSDSQLEPKGLDLGKIVTDILDALGLLGNNKEVVMEEYQALLNQRKRLEAQMSSEAKKGENRRDPDRFSVMIPDGYQLIKSEELKRMQYDLVNQRESIEELTSSNKLKEGHPDIADLSDPNRPTKLGEHFAAMYDDQWSEAYEEMCKGDEEDEEEEIKSIEKLLDVVKESYWFCEAEAENQLQKIALGMKYAVSLQNTKQVAEAGGKAGQKPGAIGGQSGPKPRATGGQSGQKSEATKGQPEKTKSSSSSGLQNKTLSASPLIGEKNGKTAEEKMKSSMSETWHIALRCARSFRKETALTAVTQIKQLFKDKYIPRIKLDPVPDAMSKYIDRCVELMWLMAVQDPPMEIKWAEHGDRSDTNCFKFYQSKGKVVRQCVWPAVFLSAHGGIVSKGYIIGMAPPPPDQVQKKRAK